MSIFAEAAIRRDATSAGAVAAKIKDKADETAAGPAQQLLQTLEQADLQVEDVEAAAAKPYAAQQCLRGKVERLDVLICAYPDEASAGKAEAKLQQFIGTAVTGLSRLRGAAALAIADRDKQDPQGKAINKVSKALQGS